MQQIDYKTLSDQELVAAHKKMKSDNLINAVLIGLFIGVSVYGAVNKGFGFFTFFPLFFAYLLFKKKKDIKLIEDELKSRGLN